MTWLFVCAVTVTGFLVLRMRYRRWLAAHTIRVSADSTIVQTSAGQVEYDVRGRGPVVLHFHGGNVGHNGWFMLDHLVEAGFRLLTPDRPGYLGTILDGNGSPAAQADLAAALLDELAVESVAVVGVSAGGPAAIQFALRYAERTRGLVLLSAITRRTQLTDDQLKSALGKLVMSRRGQNAAYFLIHQAMRRMPALALRDYVRTETTYDAARGKRYIEQVLADPRQRSHVKALTDAIVPALPRFAGVMNDIDVQRALDDMPLERIATPTLMVHSRYDGDVPYDTAVHTASRIPRVELIPVEQFGHMIWWGDARVVRDFQTRIEHFLRDTASM